jgi:hypothetical protein
MRCVYVAALCGMLFSESGAVLDSCLVLSPGRMGPNALPVPYVNRTTIDSALSVVIAADGYYDSRGDRTVNPYLSISLPLPRHAAFTVFSRPVEYYETSEEMREYRHAQERSGTSKGDLYFQTSLFMLRQERHALNLAFHLTLKTTTGKDLENARHINAPAYYFHFAFGRRFLQSEGWLRAIELTGDFSFLAWESKFNQQNDALGLGIRCAALLRNWTIAAEAAGYAGWQDNGDKPLVVRGEIDRRLGRMANLFVLYQAGLSDQPAASVKAGVRLLLFGKLYRKASEEREERDTARQ